MDSSCHSLFICARTSKRVVAGAPARQRFQLQVLGAFAVLALLLAAIGLYGALSYTAANRTAIGIRMPVGQLALTYVGPIWFTACILIWLFKPPKEATRG